MREQELYNLFASKILLLDFGIEPAFLNLKYNVAELALNEDEQNDLINEISALWNNVITHSAWDSVDEEHELFVSKNKMIDLARSQKVQEAYEDNIGE